MPDFSKSGRSVVNSFSRSPDCGDQVEKPVNELIETEGDFAVHPALSLVDDRYHVLKHNDTFAIIGRHGDIRPMKVENHGLFHDGTRFLSRLVVDFGGVPPRLLSSAVSQNIDYLMVDLTNPQFEMASGGEAAQDTIAVRAMTFLWENTYYQQLEVSNYGLKPADFTLRLRFEADYADIFEVRGVTRSRRGDHRDARVESGGVVLAYRGLDDIERQTRIAISPVPARLTGDEASFRLQLDAQESTVIRFSASCQYASAPSEALAFDEAFRRLQQRLREKQAGAVTVETSDTQFTDWISASRRDLLMLLTDTTYGLYPYAGVPWFSTVFGRDGIITALQTLWMYPDIARGVLRYLAARQAVERDDSRDAEPGKILHEERKGELANTREIPFGQYYGSIDSTPLFLTLAGRYYQRTGDRAFLEELWSAVEAALHWIDTYGDVDGDGFVEYQRKNEAGLRQQGWKDSDDSIYYANGEMARPAIALCEVQGYVYEAKRLIAEAAGALGKIALAERLRAESTALRQRFQETFWSDDLGMYALALDGDKQPCLVRSSNAGHCLFSGIAGESHAGRIAEQLLSDDLYSGWGIRTIARGEVRYNPMSYHNGSVWPHDNAMIGYGLGRYGFKDAATQVLTSLYEASNHYDLRRLPELYCGFERRAEQSPTFYPVACLPQAWAAGSVFLLLQACLGLEINGAQGLISFNQPTLPPYLDALTLRDLRIGESAVDIAVTRNGSQIEVTVLKQSGDLQVVVTP